MYLTRCIAFFLLVNAILFSACNNNKSTNGASTINPQDSLLFADIDESITYKELDSAFIKITKLENLERYNSDNLFKFKIIQLKVRALTRSKNYHEALLLCNEFINLTKEDKPENYPSKVFANYLKGDIYFELGNYQTAYKYYFKGRELSKGELGSCLTGQYDYRVSILLFLQEKYIESIKESRHAQHNYRQCGVDFNQKFRIQEISSNIGLCFYKLNTFDSALYYYQKALAEVNAIEANDTSQENYLEMARGVIYGNMGKTYIQLKNYPEAELHLKKNVKINAKINLDYNDAITSIIALGEYYLSQKNFAEFIYYINIADQYINLPKAHKQRHLVYKLKSNYNAQIKNYKDAYYYNLQYSKLKDSVDIIKQNAINSDIRLSIETLENENEINKLIKEKEVRESYIFIIISIVIALIILILTIAYFLRYSNYKNQELNQSNKEVNVQKELLKKANDEILYNLDVLKKRDVEKNKILSIVAHDLRNPNNAILSIVNTLKNETNISETQKELLDLIDVSVKSNNDLIQEILYFAKPGQYDGNNEWEVVSCKELLTQCISLNYYKAAHKNIELQLGNVDYTLNINIQLEKLRRAISNVIVNAIKFSHHHTKIQVYTTSTLEQVNIHIKDQGIGIPDRIKNSIFLSDPIIRRLGTDGEASFGLGLSIVKQTIEEHKGRISFQSNTTGTEFIITLPLHKQNT